MDIPKVSAGAGPVSTEWKQNVNAPDAPPANTEASDSFGAQLNRMAGAAPAGRNLYEKKGEMTKEAYLKMLMEQLRFQDPMNPVKNDQFSQQMTSLSQLEQQVNTNKTLDKLVQQQNNTQLAALQLVGKNISADRAAIYHDKDKPSPIQFRLPQDSPEVRLEVYSPTDEKVRTYNLGAQSQGDIKSKWDGMMDSGQIAEAGRYTYKIVAKGMDGNDIPISSKVDGRVTGVTSSQGTVFLLVGDQRVGLSDIETIKEGSLEPAPTDGKAAGTNVEPLKTASASAVANVDTAKAAPGSAKESEKKNVPELSVSGDAAKSLTGAGTMNDLMPIFMR